MGRFETAWLFKEEVGTGAWPPYVFYFAGDAFFVNLMRDGEDFFAWVSMLAGKAAAARKMVKLKIKGDRKVRGVHS